jgi:hypothetical protein
MAIFICFAAEAQFYDGSNMSFGKNRIQYQEFDWQYLRFDKFDTYFYDGGKDLAAEVSALVPAHLRDIQNKLDHVVQDRIEFIVYTSQNDFKQSNLGMEGIEGDSEIGGSAQLVGTKVFVFYDGNHQHLIRTLREGIAHYVLRDLLYGGDIKEVVKNSVLLNLPYWYTEGLVSYLVDDWTPEIRDRVADGIRYDRYAKFNRLSKIESVYAGFSLWRYISDIYGPSVIPNILYMTRLSRSMESGFVYVIGVPFDRLFKEHQIYYSNYFNQQEIGRKDPELETIHLRTKRLRTYSQFKISPDSKKAALVSNELGQYRVHLIDLDEYRREEAARKKKYISDKAAYDIKERLKQKKDKEYRLKQYKAYRPKRLRPKKIFKAEHKLDRIIDESYPVLEWNPRSTEFSFFTESKGELWLNIYSIDEGKVYPREIFGLDKVVSFGYSSKGTEMVFSGVVEGQTDIYKYYLIGNRQERLTNDSYDDLEPRFVKKDSKIIFTSDRPNDTLYVDEAKFPAMSSRDVFVLDMDDRAVLERITDTPTHNEKTPFAYDSLRYSFLSEKGLVYDRYVASYDSVISRIDTTIHYRYFSEIERLSTYRNNPIEYHVPSARGEYSILDFKDGAYRFRVGKIKNDAGMAQTSTDPDLVFPEQASSAEKAGKYQDVKVDQEIPKSMLDVDIHDYQFLGEKPSDDPQEPERDTGPVIIDDINEIIAIQSGGRDSVAMVIPKARNYRVNFVIDKADLDVTNSFQFDFYQAYRQDNRNLSPGFSPVLQWGLSDLFEDRRIVGSIGFMGGLTDLSYGLRYDNLGKRLDKAVVFQRQTQSYIDVQANARLFKSHSHLVRYLMSYPLSEVLSIRGDLLGRYERIAALSIDDVSLSTPNRHLYLGGAKLQVVFDNTLDKGLNLLNGSRAKVWAEYYHDIDFENDLYPDFGVIGFDLRHYQKLHREIQLAVRFAGNTSFGEQKLISFLGGVDNWTLPRPRYDETVPIDGTQNYAYQALVLPMRGFYRNARNGTSAAVANFELRVPIFRYALNRPIQSDLIENFQIIGFSDVGSAWTGSGPYADDNSFNSTVVDISSTQPSVTFILDNQEDPILASYGFGVRSRLLGYFMRFDWAWGIVDGQTLPAEFYFSLNLDF